MYAVIKTGGKQYKVTAGQRIKIEMLAAEVGDNISFDQVLAYGTGSEIQFGTPTLADKIVPATVLRHGRNDKVTIFKMRRRKHYQKHQGHRQYFTEVKIGELA